jgi:hypothetical protein
MGISPRKNLIDNFFDTSGWASFTLNSTNVLTLTETNHVNGGVVLLFADSVPTVGGSTTLSTGEYAEVRTAFQLAASPTITHPFHNLVAVTNYQSTIFSVSSVANTTGIADGLIASIMGLNRLLLNIKILFIPPNANLLIRLGTLNSASVLNAQLKFLPFVIPSSFYSVGSWTSGLTLGLSNSTNLTQLDSGILSSPLPPGFWFFLNAMNYNNEPSVTKSQSISITRLGTTPTVSAYKINIRSASTQTGNTVICCPLTILEKNSVNRVNLVPINSSTTDTYLSAFHIPYVALTQLL